MDTITVENCVKPSSVTVAVNLVWSVVVLTVLRKFWIAYSWPPEIIRSAIWQIISVSDLIIEVTLLSVIAINLSKGKRWARVCFAIIFFLIFAEVMLDNGKFFTTPLMPDSIRLLQLFLSACSMVLLFQKPGNSWFRKAVKVTAVNNGA